MTSQTVLLDFTVSDNIDINLCEDIIKNFFDEKLSIDSSSGTLQLEFKNSGQKLSSYISISYKQFVISCCQVLRLTLSPILVLETCSWWSEFTIPQDLSPSTLTDNLYVAVLVVCSKMGPSIPHLHSFGKLRQILSILSPVWQENLEQINTIHFRLLPEVWRWPLTGLQQVTLETFYKKLQIFFTDDRIIECPIQSIVHDETSPYQRIQILDTIDFGRWVVLNIIIDIIWCFSRVLLLDGQTQLAESDDIYTKSLMSDVDYTGADILILGGGDGALLAQLLTKNPRMVTMVELDGAVMRVVREFMHSVTGGVLDKHEGERYKIITGE